MDLLAPLAPANYGTAPAVLAAASPAPGRSDADLEKTARDFETVLIGKLLDSMKATVGKSGLLDGGISDQYQDIFWHYLVQGLSAKGGLGLWKQLFHQLKANQPAAAAAAAENRK